MNLSNIILSKKVNPKIYIQNIIHFCIVKKNKIGDHKMLGVHISTIHFIKGAWWQWKPCDSGWLYLVEWNCGFGGAGTL